MWQSVLITLLTLAVGSVGDAVDCPCGYTINATTDRNHAVFTEILETDFLHVKNVADLQDWVPQAYDVRQEDSNSPFGKAAEVGNVMANPVKGSEWDWGGPGESGEDAGLQLWARTKRIEGMVPMAEVVSARDDILYGSFRIGMKTTAVNGTCGAFFFYFNDSNEIDMEFLSRQNQDRTVNLVLQSPQSAEQGYASGPDFVKHHLSFAPETGYNEYRFDWLPDRVDFYANAVLISSITETIPKVAGKIHVSHWSNGNPGWSAGPPEADALLTVSYVKAYFNTTSSTHNAARSLGSCTEDPKRTCEIPDQTVPPDPNGPNGNETGHTFFFRPTNESSGGNEVDDTGTGGSVGIPTIRVFLVMGLCVLLALVLQG